jgi:hypothetical protein
MSGRLRHWTVRNLNNAESTSNFFKKEIDGDSAVQNAPPPSLSPGMAFVERGSSSNGPFCSRFCLANQITFRMILNFSGSWFEQCIMSVIHVYPKVKKCLTKSTLMLLMWRIGWAPNSILIYSYIQQDVTLHSLIIYGNCSIFFGWYLHLSSRAQTTVSTASGICHTVTAICRYHGRVGTGLSVLWVAYVTRSTLKPVPTLPR